MKPPQFWQKCLLESNVVTWWRWNLSMQVQHEVMLFHGGENR